MAKEPSKFSRVFTKYILPAIGAIAISLFIFIVVKGA